MPEANKGAEATRLQLDVSNCLALKYPPRPWVFTRSECVAARWFAGWIHRLPGLSPIGRPAALGAGWL